MDTTRLSPSYVRPWNTRLFSLGTALEKNMSLQGVYLYRNQIGNEGAKALARALETNTGICSLPNVCQGGEVCHVTNRCVSDDIVCSFHPLIVINVPSRGSKQIAIHIYNNLFSAFFPH